LEFAHSEKDVQKLKASFENYFEDRPTTSTGDENGSKDKSQKPSDIPSTTTTTTTTTATNDAQE